MENEQLHNRMMSILRQRAANGEGEDYGDGEDYGGWAKGYKLTPEQRKKQYYAQYKKRNGTSVGVLAAWKKLQKSKRKVTKRKVTKRKVGKKNDIDSMKVPQLKAFLKRKKVRGYSKLRKAQLIKLAKKVEND